MTDSIMPEFQSLINKRKNKDSTPIYKIIARSRTVNDESVVMLHKAGEDHVINFYVKDLIKHEEILAQMDPKEAELMRWVVFSEVTNPLEQKYSKKL
jgi:hypothetical protein